MIAGKQTKNKTVHVKYYYSGVGINRSESEQNFESSRFSEWCRGLVFQGAIHFHPGHLQPKTLIFTLRAASGIILYKTGPLVWGFH